MKIDITICLGSSCFSRGNKQTVQIIKNYLKSNLLEDKVLFHGNHCNGNCENGPIIKVDGKEFQNILPENTIYLLDSIFKKN